MADASKQTESKESQKQMGLFEDLLQMLVNDGLVEKKPGKGSIVLNRDAAKRSPSPSPAAASASYRNIGFLLPSGNAITQPFYSTLFFVLEREFKRFNFSLIYSTFNEQDDLLKTIADYNLSGIVFVSNTNSPAKEHSGWTSA